ncbi:hypothetical protein OIU78_000572 [Salix suchowensis]|nr:hypothetical protein OIU78_000572 [Salix suchowensis]
MGDARKNHLRGLLNFCGRRVTQLMPIHRRQKTRFASYRAEDACYHLIALQVAG